MERARLRRPQLSKRHSGGQRGDEQSKRSCARVGQRCSEREKLGAWARRRPRGPGEAAAVLPWQQGRGGGSVELQQAGDAAEWEENNAKGRVRFSVGGALRRSKAGRYTSKGRLMQAGQQDERARGGWEGHGGGRRALAAGRAGSMPQGGRRA